MRNNELQNIYKLHNQTEIIDWLRFPLVILVIFIHSFGLPKQVNVTEIDFTSLSGMDIYNIIRTIVTKIASICNFMFFMFSGYLFFINVTNFNIENYIKKLKTRISTLFIPYILWNIIDALYIIIKRIADSGDWKNIYTFWHEVMSHGVWNVFWHYRTWGNEINIIGWSTQHAGPLHTPMWFLQTLILLTIATPLVYLLCKHLKLYGVTLIGILYCTGIWPILPGFSIGAIFFFTIGAYLSIHKKNIIEKTKKNKYFCYILSLLTLLPTVYFDYNGVIDYNFFSSIFILTTVASAINITHHLFVKKIIHVNKTLTQATFFVYCIHTIWILYAIGSIFDALFQQQSAILLILRYLTIPVITAYVCVGIYCIMKKTTPKTLSVLSGNR